MVFKKTAFLAPEIVLYSLNALDANATASFISAGVAS